MWILRSSFSSALVNGHTGSPFRCKCGLQQGDPLSPYLFILAVDVLSCILNLAYEGGIVQKGGSWNPGITCLQYADDTIMLLPPNLISIKRVKILIYIFELISGFPLILISHPYINLGPRVWTSFMSLPYCTAGWGGFPLLISDSL